LNGKLYLHRNSTAWWEWSVDSELH